MQEASGPLPTPETLEPWLVARASLGAAITLEGKRPKAAEAIVAGAQRRHMTLLSSCVKAAERVHASFAADFNRACETWASVAVSTRELLRTALKVKLKEGIVCARLEDGRRRKIRVGDPVAVFCAYQILYGAQREITEGLVTTWRRPPTPLQNTGLKTSAEYHTGIAEVLTPAKIRSCSITLCNAMVTQRECFATLIGKETVRAAVFLQSHDKGHLDRDAFSSQVPVVSEENRGPVCTVPNLLALSSIIFVF